MLLVWVAASPLFTNLINIPKDSPFFGSYRIVDYVGYASGPAKHLVEFLSFDRNVLILIFLSVLRRIKSPANPPVANLQMSLGIFTCVVYLSALFSHNVPNALRKATDTFGLCYLAFIIGRCYLTGPNACRRFEAAMLVLGLILGIICLVEYRNYAEWNLDKYDDMYRVTGPFQFWETLGMAVALVAYVAWFCWATCTGKKARLKRLFFVSLAGLMGWCIFRTQTRTIMLGLAMGVGTVLYYARGTIMNKAQMRLVLALFALCCAFLILAPAVLTNSRFYQNTLNRRATQDGRKETYIAATRMFLNNPITGIGLKNFIADMKLYMSAREAVVSSMVDTSCHSSYFVIAAECGLLGLVSFSALIWCAIQLCKQLYEQGLSLADKAWGVTMLGMSITYFYCGTTFDPFFDPTMQNQLYFLCLGCTAGRLEASRSPC